MIRNLRACLRDKLRNQQGDSMVEALTAILIAVLGATMLATMVIAATSVAAKSQQTLSSSYESETTLAKAMGKDAKVIVSVPSSTGATTSVEIDVLLSQSGGYERYETSGS